MDGYFCKDGKLDNQVCEINYQDILELIKQNEADRLQCEAITADSYEGGNCYDNSSNFLSAFFAEVLVRDKKTAGFVMQYPHGTVIRQAERGHFYRGERQLYPKSVSTLLRRIEQLKLDCEQAEIYRFIADMRIHQFGTLIYEFEHTNNWSQKYCDVLIESLAQHYGLETTWLDITNDFCVAMFFATCFFDCIENKWKPLTKSMIEKNENGKYGIIFHIPNWQADLKTMLEFFPSNAPNNAVLPIGFQPFMRCHMQYGYGINMQQEKPLQLDNHFEKLKFRQSEQLSNEIYELMGQGKLIYPHEGLLELQNIIDTIKSTTIFTESDFLYAFEKSGYFLDIKKCKEIICNSNILSKKIVIGSQPSFELSSKVINSINEKYKSFSIEKDYGIKLMSRKVCFPNS